MQNNALIAWLSENLNRLFAKSPKFFRVWQIIAVVLVLITGLPQLFEQFDINLPTLWNDRVNSAIAWASRGLLLMSLLSVQSKPIGVTDDGTVIKATNEKLPFTASNEAKSAVKKDLPKVDVTTQ